MGSMTPRGNVVFQKLERKIEQLKYQMCENENVNLTISDPNTDSQVENNQESEEVLNMETNKMIEEIEIRKANSALNLDGITDLDESEAKIEIKSEEKSEEKSKGKCEDKCE